MSNKKTKKRRSNLRKKTAAKKRSSVRKTVRKKQATKKAAPKKKAAARTAAKTKRLGKKTVGAKPAGALKKPVTRKSQTAETIFAVQPQRLRTAGQAGDLQGMSGVEGADSESVDELLEEGNAFEADVVAGAENAGDAAEKEVRTHEVREDDVPGEYLDNE